MNFLEKDLEEIIWESDEVKLFEKGFYISGKKFRQLKIGNYGVADIVTFNRHYSDRSHIIISIYEFKRDSAGISAFFQAVRYMKGIDRYLKRRDVNFSYSFNIILCARKIETNDYIYLADFISRDCNKGGLVGLYSFSYEYDIDGITFEQMENYSLENEGFDVKA